MTEPVRFVAGEQFSYSVHDVEEARHDGYQQGYQRAKTIERHRRRERLAELVAGIVAGIVIGYVLAASRVSASTPIPSPVVGSHPPLAVPSVSVPATPSGEMGTAVEAGVASFVGPRFGATYLALPEGPGVRVRICAQEAPSRCVDRTSTDAGPDLAMQREGRIADVSFTDFAFLCSCDPWLVGLMAVTVERGAASVTLPPTDLP